MVAYALEAPTALLPFLPELLADLDELGSDAELIANVLTDLRLPPMARVIDLGCGKGAVSIEIAAELGLQVLGIELFAPFVAHCVAAARQAGVDQLCEFRQGDAKALVGSLPPADVVVFAALGDVLGSPSETMRVVRQYVRSGGFIVIADAFLRDGGSTSFAGFESYRSRQETVNGLTHWGDTVVREVLEAASTAVENDEDAAAIYRRAVEIAARHPEHANQLLAFARYQAEANEHISENLSGAVWVLQRI